MLDKILKILVCLGLAVYTYTFSRKRKAEGKRGARWYLIVSLLLVLGSLEVIFM